MHSYLRNSKRAVARQTKATVENRSSTTRTPQYGQPHILAKMQKEVNELSGSRKPDAEQVATPRKSTFDGKSGSKPIIKTRRSLKSTVPPAANKGWAAEPASTVPGHRPKSVAAGEVLVATKRRRRLVLEVDEQNN